jgi:molybdopterin-guanine dinucleotide biosynthesis protein A
LTVCHDGAGNSWAHPRRRAGAAHGRRRQGDDRDRRTDDRVAPQCARTIINANGAPSRFAFTGLPVVADDVADYPGPLAGILTALEWATANAPAIEWVVSVPGDCPFLPRDLVGRLHQARAAANTPLACARSGEWRHPVVGLWRVDLRGDLRHALVAEGLRKIEVWTARHGIAVADWSTEPVDPFFNVNTPEDVAAATRIAAAERV